MAWLNFAQKLAFTMTTLVLLAAILIGYPMFHRQSSMLEDQFETLGRTLSTQASAAAVELVFSDDRFGIERLVSTFEEQTDVRSVIIMNRDFQPFGTLQPRPPKTILMSEAPFESSGVFQDNNISWFYTPIVFDQANNTTTGGVAWIGIDKSELIQNKNIVTATALVVVVMFMLAIILIAFRLSQALSRPISELIKATQAVASGNLSYRIRRSQTGEFAELKDAFNDMAEGLEQKITLEKNFSRFVSPSVADHYKDRDDKEMSLHGERVDASIIYVDLVNYTGFSEAQSPETVADVLNFYFTEFSQACHLFQGNVDKYIGDCAMLVFGCPHEDPSHRQHAIECALYIRNRIRQLNKEREEQDIPWLDIRIGLSGGTVLAGLLGSPERLNYSVIGDAANLAARLCEKAPTGEILTDRDFLNHLHMPEQISTYETQRIDVKGFSEQIDTLVVDEISSQPEQPQHD